VYTQFSGRPQCFLTAEQLVFEMQAAGFAIDPSHPLRELNRRPGALPAGGPVIYEGVFRRQGESMSHITPAVPVAVAELVSYQDNGVVSRQLVKKAAGNITAFAFDAGQELTEHSSPFEAVIEVVEGEATVVIAGQPHDVRQGEMIVLPASVPHAVRAKKRFKMLLTMIRS
jgi:quercetin dioxygenase-like cupin family protein